MYPGSQSVQSTVASLCSAADWGRRSGGRSCSTPHRAAWCWGRRSERRTPFQTVGWMNGFKNVKSLSYLSFFWFEKRLPNLRARWWRRSCSSGHCSRGPRPGSAQSWPFELPPPLQSGTSCWRCSGKLMKESCFKIEQKWQLNGTTLNFFQVLMGSSWWATLWMTNASERVANRRQVATKSWNFMVFLFKELF